MPLAPTVLLPLLALSIFDLDSDRPTSSVDASYIELLERNSHIVYPALALMVLGMVAVAILQASKAQEMDGAVKAEFKKLIVDELRRYPAGLETPDLASATGLDRSKLVRLSPARDTERRPARAPTVLSAHGRSARTRRSGCRRADTSSRRCAAISA